MSDRNPTPTETESEPSQGDMHFVTGISAQVEFGVVKHDDSDEPKEEA
jgi:hypothetical protein